MALDERQQRSLLLLGGVLALVAMAVGLFLLTNRGNPSGPTPDQKLTATDVQTITGVATDFTTAAANFGGKPFPNTNNFMNDLALTLSEDPAYYTPRSDAAGEALSTYAWTRVTYPTDQTVPLDDETALLGVNQGFMGLSSSNLVTTKPQRYFVNDQGEKEVMVSVSYQAHLISYEAKLSTLDKSNVDIWGWDNKTMLQKEGKTPVALKLTITEKNGAWKVASVGGVTQPGLLAFDTRPIFDIWNQAATVKTFEVPNYPSMSSEGNVITCVTQYMGCDAG